jgi:hypothetical protein
MPEIPAGCTREEVLRVHVATAPDGTLASTRGSAAACIELTATPSRPPSHTMSIVDVSESCGMQSFTHLSPQCDTLERPVTMCCMNTTAGDSIAAIHMVPVPERHAVAPPPAAFCRQAPDPSYPQGTFALLKGVLHP